MGGWNGATFWDGGVRISYSFVAGLLIYRSKWIIKNNFGFVSLSLLLFLAFIVPSQNGNRIKEPLIVLFYFPLLIALGAGAKLSPPSKTIPIFLGKSYYPLYMRHYAALWMFDNYYLSQKAGPWQLTFIIIAGIILIITFSYLVMVLYDILLRKYSTNKWNYKATTS